MPLVPLTPLAGLLLVASDGIPFAIRYHTCATVSIIKLIIHSKKRVAKILSHLGVMASFPKGHPLGALALTSKFGVTRSTRSGHHLPWPLSSRLRKEIPKKPTPYTKNGHSIRMTPLQRQLNQVFRPCPHPYILLKFHRTTLNPLPTPPISTQHHGHHPNINRSLIEAMCVFSCGHLTSDFH
jgi:hypothetical protein